MVIGNAIRNTFPNGLLIFGLFQPVYPFTAERVQKLENRGLFRCCSARDQHGNLYDIYTDYDPCLQISETVAIQMTTNK